MNPASQHHDSPRAGGVAQRLKGLTPLCIGGLALGVAVGLLLHATAFPWAEPLVGGSEAGIRAWTNAFRLIVTPLVMAQLYTAITAGRFTSKDAGRLGLVVPVVFLFLLLAVALVTISAGGWALSLPVFADIGLGPHLAAASPGVEPAAAASGAAWVDTIVPPNLFRAADADKILPLMLFALVFGLAARRIAEPLKRILDEAAQAMRDGLFVLVEWLLMLAPVVMLALGIQAAAADGVRVGGGLLVFVLLTNALLLLAVGVLYPLTVLLGRVPLRRFARAAFPAQVAALATRSSLATIPLLLRGAREVLELPPASAATVIPLAGAMLKLSVSVVGCTRLVFLAHVLGVPIGAEDFAVFLVTILLLSPSTVGLPTVAYPGTTIPAYVAVGIPAGHIVLLGTTTALTDPFETLLNSTSYLSASVLVARFDQTSAEGLVPDPGFPGTAESALP